MMCRSQNHPRLRPIRPFLRLTAPLVGLSTLASHRMYFLDSLTMMRLARRQQTVIDIDSCVCPLVHISETLAHFCSSCRATCALMVRACQPGRDQKPPDGTSPKHQSLRCRHGQAWKVSGEAVRSDEIEHDFEIIPSGCKSRVIRFSMRSKGNYSPRCPVGFSAKDHHNAIPAAPDYRSVLQIIGAMGAREAISPQ